MCLLVGPVAASMLAASLTPRAKLFHRAVLLLKATCRQPVATAHHLTLQGYRLPRPGQGQDVFDVPCEVRALPSSPQLPRCHHAVTWPPPLTGPRLIRRRLAASNSSPADRTPTRRSSSTCSSRPGCSSCSPTRWAPTWRFRSFPLVRSRRTSAAGTPVNLSGPRLAVSAFW